jgi:hypothetical protein
MKQPLFEVLTSDIMEFTRFTEGLLLLLLLLLLVEVKLGSLHLLGRCAITWAISTSPFIWL